MKNLALKLNVGSLIHTYFYGQKQVTFEKVSVFMKDKNLKILQGPASLQPRKLLYQMDPLTENNYKLETKYKKQLPQGPGD